MRRYYVYILASKSRVLYVGITNDLWRRVGEHKNNVFPGFTSKYRIHRLVYVESFKYVGNAITREKHIKGWLREKKIALIRSSNPTWEDLSQTWFDGKEAIRIQFRPNNSDSNHRLTNHQLAGNAAKRNLPKGFVILSVAKDLLPCICHPERSEGPASLHLSSRA